MSSGRTDYCALTAPLPDDEPKDGTPCELRKVNVLAERGGCHVQMTFHVHPEVSAARLAAMMGAEFDPEATFARMPLEQLRAWAEPAQLTQLSREATQALVGEIVSRLDD